MRKVLLTVLSLSMLASTAAYGASCRNAKGKFVKCTTLKVTKAVHCKDSKGRFARCGVHGAKPA